MHRKNLTAGFAHWQQLIGVPSLQTLQHPLLREKQVTLDVLRTDRVHPVISGNKAYKLKYNLQAALDQNAAGILSFGGAWSNHLHALAYSCHLLDIPCVAVIRGEPELIAKSALLQDLEQWGCTLHFVSRKTYRLRDDPEWLAALAGQFPDYFIVPEGGSSPLAAPGIAELAVQLEQACAQAQRLPDQVWCAVGTGGTLAGLIAGRRGDYQLVGVPVLKGADFLRQDIRARLVPCGTAAARRWHLITDGHFGGYGKVTAEYLTKMQALEQALSTDETLLLDPVYTGKLFCRFWQALQQDEIAPGSRVVLIHTGGLQGRRGFGLSQGPVC